MSTGYTPDKYPVVYDEGEGQLYYQNNGNKAVLTASASTFLTASVTFTDAQIKSMPLADAFEVIPAPGLGKAIVPIIIITNTNIAVPYTPGGLPSVEGDGFYVAFPSVDVLTISNTATVNGFDAFINNSTFKMCPPVAEMYYDADWGSVLPTASIRDKSFFENIPLNATIGTTNGNLTGGDSANSLTITVLYALIDV